MMRASRPFRLRIVDGTAGRPVVDHVGDVPLTAEAQPTVPRPTGVAPGASMLRGLSTMRTKFGSPAWNWPARALAASWDALPGSVKPPPDNLETTLPPKKPASANKISVATITSLRRRTTARANLTSKIDPPPRDLRPLS